LSPAVGRATPSRNGKPAYRCRHGYSSAVVAGPARRGNAYVREEQVLPHLAAIAILLAAPAGHAEAPENGGRAQLAGPDSTAVLIDRLRAEGTVLTFDPDSRMLRAGGRDAPAVILGTGTAVTRSRQARERRTAQGSASQGALAVATGKDH